MRIFTATLFVLAENFEVISINFINKRFPHSASSILVNIFSPFFLINISLSENEGCGQGEETLGEREREEQVMKI